MSHSTRQPATVNLRELLPAASFVGCGDIPVSAVTEHSSECTPGCLFAALPGTHTHGREHLKHALLGGAAAILTDRPLAEIPLPQCIVPDVRQAFGLVCHGLHAFPSRRLGVAGVTGTNGKTTVTWIVRSLLESVSQPTGVIGTIEYNDGLESVPSRLTTPDSATLARWLAAMRERRTTHAAIELSSHALKQGRAAGLWLDVAIVTNLTRDHLDYHPDFEDYVRSKARIAGLLKRGGVLVLNADDPCQQAILETIPSVAQVRTFGIDQPADVQAERVELTPQGSRFRLTAGTDSVDCRCPLVGKHNISNVLAAVSAALHFGMTLSQIAPALETLGPVPGRLERVDRGQPYSVFVDYAHTDDALRRVVAAVREVTPGRVLLVCGAGGDRDQSKRPLMGAAAATADEVIFTSDNPRSENPDEIIAQMIAGVDLSRKSPQIHCDRREAIGAAFDQACLGDAVIIAGKGHEREQVIHEQRLPFDDVAVCRELLLARRRDGLPLRDGLLHTA